MSDKVTPLIVRGTPDIGGTQKLYRFDNDLGASVVRHQFSYGNTDGLWELAVIRWDGDDDWQITYETPITEDVIGHLTDADVEALLALIAALPKAEATS